MATQGINLVPSLAIRHRILRTFVDVKMKYKVS
jgi:hypothetical protein